jgi:hypothetical protein
LRARVSNDTWGGPNQIQVRKVFSCEVVIYLLGNLGKTPTFQPFFGLWHASCFASKSSFLRAQNLNNRTGLRN